jgi:hypothetical protein
MRRIRHRTISAMSNTARIALAAVALLGLAGCGKSVDANQSATADTVEIPAEQAMASVTAMPTDMASAPATEDVSSASDTPSGAVD